MDKELFSEMLHAIIILGLVMLACMLAIKLGGEGIAFFAQQMAVFGN